VLGASALLLIANPELRRAALAPVEHAAELAGLGLQQVSLSGHRFTADTDIYAALDLDRTPTLLSFDAGAARARIEQLPWIRRASIERIGPDRLHVRVTERAPYAVWRTEGQSWLIDRAGRRLQAAPADVMPRLMRVSGEGAGKDAGALAGLLVDFPQVAGRLEVAERVAGRRWTLHLKNGTSVELPATGEAEALARLAHLIELGLDGASRIDLRVAARVLVQGLAPASAERVPSGSAGRT
jgi:cell division protein FtsQ